MESFKLWLPVIRAIQKKMIELTYFDILNIPAILMLGVVTSFQDLKEGKIRNKWIIISVLYSFFSLGLTALLLRMSGSSINPEYVRIFFANIGFSLAFAVFIWLCKLWSAGDAKLFVAYAALIPLSTYKWQVVAIFPAYILLINTFTPIFVFFLARMLIRLNPKMGWEELKKSFQPKTILSFALFIFGFSVIGNLFFGLTGIQPNMILITMFLFLVLIFFTTAVKVDLLKVSIVFAVLRLVLDFRQVITLGFWVQFTLTIFAFMLLRYFVLNLGSRAFARQTYIEDLKPGMCLVYDVVEDKGTLKHKRTVSYSFLQSMLQAFGSTKSVLSDYSCLSKEDVEKLQKGHSAGKLKEHIILVYDKIGFAVFMFVGAIVTLIVKGDLIVAIRLALESFI